MESTIIKRAEYKVRQKLFGGVILLVCALMIVNSLGLVQAANVNANVTFNVTSGSFTITNGPTQIRFGSNAYGVSGNVHATDNANNIVVTDYRGSSAAWSVAVNANDLSDGTHTIYANKIKLYQDTNGYLTNIANCTTSKVTLGANGNIANAGVTLMNTSSSAGVVQYDNGFFNLTLTGTDSAGTYGALIIFTLT
jgi:hypothetical protein